MQQKNGLLQDHHRPQSHLPLPSSHRCLAGLSYLLFLPRFRPPQVLLLGPGPPPSHHGKPPFRHLSPKHRDGRQVSVAQLRLHRLVSRYSIHLPLGVPGAVWPLSSGEIPPSCTVLYALDGSGFGPSVRFVARAGRQKVIRVQPRLRRCDRSIYSKSIDRTARTSCVQQRFPPCPSHRPTPRTGKCPLPRPRSHRFYLR